MPCILVRDQIKICWSFDPPAQPLVGPAQDPVSPDNSQEQMLDADLLTGIAPNDELLNSTSGTNISNGLVSTTTNYDSFQATSDLNSDIYRLGGVSEPIVSTSIESLDSSAIAEDAVAVNFDADSTFL